MNNAFQPPARPPTSAVSIEIQYGIAVAATIANILVIVGFISKKELREANLFIIFLAAGDMLQGLGLGLNHGDPGPPPGGSAGPDNFSLQNCSFSNGKITIAKIGIQLQTLATVFIAAERFLAVKTPIWFYSCYNLKYKYVAIVVLLLLACLSFCIAILSNCSNSLNYWYELFNETFIIFFQLFVLVICLYVMISAKRKSATVATMSREARKVRSILAVSAFSVVLIAFPHAIIVAISYGNINPQNYPFLMYLAPKTALLIPLNSLSNFFIYLILSAGFRRQWVKILCFCKHFLNRNKPTTAFVRTNRVNQVNVRNTAV
jgi:hypothetical protein